MKLTELDPNQHRLAVVYGGRFQPFHKGHYKAYKWLCKQFGANHVWIAASNKTNFNSKNGKISPFNFEEKKEIILGLYDDIPANRIIQCKNPAFSPKEVFKLFKGFLPVYVAAVGGKDLERYQGGHFFKPLPKDFDPKQLQDMYPVNEDLGYYVEVPHEHSVSATKVRNALLSASSKDVRKALFKKFFGHYDDTIADLVMSRLKSIRVAEPEDEPAPEQLDKLEAEVKSLDSGEDDEPSKDDEGNAPPEGDENLDDLKSKVDDLKDPTAEKTEKKKPKKGSLDDLEAEVKKLK